MVNRKWSFRSGKSEAAIYSAPLTVIDFSLFANPGYWYQQEILKLVMRVYHEGSWMSSYDYQPSVLDDGWLCLRHLQDWKNGQGSAAPNEDNTKAFQELYAWLTEGIDSGLHSFQGPVLKPLQSLFNKMFIRRGQTSVHVVGDMVRATLLVDDRKTLQQIASRIEMTLPNIINNQFHRPDTSDGGLVDIFAYVDEKLAFIPTSSTVLPYRFKMNSSQKKKKEVLWYNFNFFHQVPEYHRVGQSKMYVASELQIGLTSEVISHRKSHDAYERDRILSNQPLLKNYDTALKEMTEEKGDKISNLSANSNDKNKEARNGKFGSNCSDDDVKLIENVLFGRIGTEVLVPSSTTADVGDGANDDVLTFESGPYMLSKDQLYKKIFVKPNKLCVNNRSLNKHIAETFEEDWYGRVKVALVVAGPYSLNDLSSTTTTASTRRRYYVESCMMHNPLGLTGTIGLYAQVGSYLVEIACSGSVGGENVLVQDPGQNVSYLERICPIPRGATSLIVIVHGVLDLGDNFQYENVTLSLKIFEQI